MFMQNTNDIGNILLHRSSEATSINGFVFSTLIAIYAPIEEHMKWTHDTVRGNLNSNFCQIQIQNSRVGAFVPSKLQRPLFSTFKQRKSIQINEKGKESSFFKGLPDREHTPRASRGFLKEHSKQGNILLACFCLLGLFTVLRYFTRQIIYNK